MNDETYPKRKTGIKQVMMNYLYTHQQLMLKR
jgi:hypothetical protein